MVIKTRLWGMAVPKGKVDSRLDLGARAYLRECEGFVNQRSMIWIYVVIKGSGVEGISALYSLSS